MFRTYVFLMVLATLFFGVAQYKGWRAFGSDTAERELRGPGSGSRIYHK
jgi:hypothetical protein